MDKKTIGISLLVIAGIGVILYFLYQKGKAATGISAFNGGTATGSTGTVTDKATSSNDKQTFDKLVATLDRYDKAAMNWVLPMVEQYANEEANQGTDTLIKGKKTLSGSFMSAFFAGYNVSKPNVELYNELMSIFTKFRLSAF